MKIDPRVKSIAARRRACGLRLETLCRRARVNKETLRRWRLGLNSPQLAVLDRVLGVLNREEKRERDGGGG